MGEKSRQQVWQEKKKAQGLCVKCGEPKVNASYCEKHRIQFNVRHAVYELNWRHKQEAEFAERKREAI